MPISRQGFDAFYGSKRAWDNAAAALPETAAIARARSTTLLPLVPRDGPEAGCPPRSVGRPQRQPGPSTVLVYTMNLEGHSLRGRYRLWQALTWMAPSNGTMTARLWRTMRRREQEPSTPSIEMAFAKLKVNLRAKAIRTIDALWQAIGDMCNLFSPTECRKYFTAAGYGLT